MNRETLIFILLASLAFGVWFYYYKYRPLLENPATPGFKYVPPGFVGPPSPVS